MTTTTRYYISDGDIIRQVQDDDLHCTDTTMRAATEAEMASADPHTGYIAAPAFVEA